MSVPNGAGGVGGPSDPEPPAFALAVASLRGARPRPEVRLSEVRPPQRLAPYAIAISGSVPLPGSLADDEDGDDLATGRLVVLHDPDGHESWHGCTRLVAYVRADLDPDMAGDPMLGSVGWSWLLEALAGHGAKVTAAGGTVTRASSESFGALSEQRATAELEIRASWSPLEDDLTAHLAGWCDLLCYAAGVPPVTPGVASLAGARVLRP
ncbi:MAG: hypothetical protein QOE76_1910 [Frankiales bacterium]|jgi:hypothetical protein|nr:hypothetical protein [Frankiales bacterium]MDX6244187.1 hypothetical protein [Frankiales bacterium]